MEFRRIKREHKEEPERSGAAALLLALLQRVGRPARAPQESSDSLQPAGNRSGSGTDSLVPYLDQARNSRPAPLE